MESSGVPALYGVGCFSQHGCLFTERFITAPLSPIYYMYHWWMRNVAASRATDSRVQSDDGSGHVWQRSFQYGHHKQNFFNDN